MTIMRDLAQEKLRQFLDFNALAIGQAKNRHPALFAVARCPHCRPYLSPCRRTIFGCIPVGQMGFTCPFSITLDYFLITKIIIGKAFCMGDSGGSHHDTVASGLAAPLKQDVPQLGGLGALRRRGQARGEGGRRAVRLQGMGRGSRSTTRRRSVTPGGCARTSATPPPRTTRRATPRSSSC
jgi:hypothetical protein